MQLVLGCAAIRYPHHQQHMQPSLAADLAPLGTQKCPTLSSAARTMTDARRGRAGKQRGLLLLTRDAMVLVGTATRVIIAVTIFAEQWTSGIRRTQNIGSTSALLVLLVSGCAVGGRVIKTGWGFTHSTQRITY